METPVADELQDFNIDMGSEAELRQRQEHIDQLRSMTSDEAKSSIMLLNVCNAAERVRAGIEEFEFSVDGHDRVAYLPWYKPYSYTPNDMDELRALVRCDNKVFGLFVGSTDRLLYDQSTVLDDDGGEWTLVSHSSLRLRSGTIYDAGMRPVEDETPMFTSPLWTLYAILECLLQRISLLHETSIPLDVLSPHSETNIFDLSLLTRAFLELVAFTRASGARVFSAETNLLTSRGFDTTIGDDAGIATVTPSDGLQDDVFTAWYCHFLNHQIKRANIANLNEHFDTETVERLAEISAGTAYAEKLRRLLIVYQCSGDDEIWRAVQAAIIAGYIKSDYGVELVAGVHNELPSSARCYFFAVMDEFEEELTSVVPELDIAQVGIDAGEPLSTGVMHMAHSRYSSLATRTRLCGISFGPGRGIELSMPQESMLRVRIKDEKFRLRIGNDGLVVEEDNLFAKIVRVLNNLPEITILSSGIGKPDVRRPEVSQAWLVNLILAGKAGIDKAIWVLRVIFNGLLDVDISSSKASYIPNTFKKEGSGIRIESHLDWRVSQKLCYITDGKDAFLVKDQDCHTGFSLKRRSPSTISCAEVALKDLDRKKPRKYNTIALLSRCKLA